MAIFTLLCVTALLVTVQSLLHQDKIVFKFGNRLDTTRYKDCHHLHQAGYRTPATYEIWINDQYPIKVHCENHLNSSATVIQRRENGGYSFQQPMSAYIAGFGYFLPQRGDFWLGLNNINYLTSVAGNTVLTIVLQDWNENFQQLTYSNFRVMDSTQGYRMYVGPKTSGSLVDDFSHNNGMPFATQDNPDPRSCAIHQRSGWWFNDCSYALLNGNYYYGGNYNPHEGYYDGIYWKDWYGYGYSLKFTSMSVSHP